MSAGVGRHADWQRVEVGLIGRHAVKAPMRSGHCRSPGNGITPPYKGRWGTFFIGLTHDCLEPGGALYEVRGPSNLKLTDQSHQPIDSIEIIVLTNNAEFWHYPRNDELADLELLGLVSRPRTGRPVS